MSAQDSEEKKHDPTDSKIRRLRREGIIPRSEDLVRLSVFPVLLWLLFNHEGFLNSLRRFMLGAVTVDYNTDVASVVRAAPYQLLEAVVQLSLPLLLVSALAGIVLSILDHGGIVFSGNSLSPDFSRINPVSGFGRIFSMRTTVEAAVALVKLLAIAGITLALVYTSVPALQRSQSCGENCLDRALELTLQPLIGLVFVVFILSAISDFLISRALFRKEQRMTDTELKRDQKESYGSPEFKRHRRDINQSQRSGPARMGLHATTMMIVGADEIVGLRYIAAETPAPFVVFKMAGLGRNDALVEASARGITLTLNAPLAATLYERGQIGGVIPRETFTEVAKEIIKQEK